MSSSDSMFDQVDGQYQKRPEKPFWMLPLDDKDPGSEKVVLDWLNGELGYLNEVNRPRFDEIRDNLDWYKGIAGAGTRSDTRDAPAKTSVAKVSSNDTFDLLEARAARLLKYRPAVAILPANDEHSDKIGAKACKNLLDYIWYQQQLEDEQLPEFVTNVMSMGECFMFELWNPDKGDLQPEFKEKYADALDAGEEVFLLDENGEPELDEQGNKIKITEEVRTGDVEHRIVLTSDVRLHRPPSRRYRDADYVFYLEEMPIEEARLRYPKAASKIKAAQSTGGTDIYDLESGVRQVEKGNILLVHFYHRKTKPLAKGRHIVFTQDAVVHSDVYPYSTRELPCDRLTDDDFTGELHGRSFISRVRQLVASKSKLTNMILRNQFMVSHPKWLVPAGSVKLESLGNDITITQYKGPVAPVLAQMNPTPREVFEFRQMLGEEVFKKAGIGDVARGEPPAGIKAFVALQFMSEQEQELFNRLILKLNAFIKNVARKDLACAGDYYDADDARMIRVQGKSNRWMSVFFDVSHLSKPYDVRIQGSSALPQSKGARIQSVIDLNKEFPGLMPQEQLVEILDLGQSEEFVNAVTASARAAKAENEELMEGKDVPAPDEFENHVVHWQIHVQQLQEWAFKRQTPPEIQDAVKDHLRAHEMLMSDKARQNPIYLQKLGALDGFPLLFLPPELAPANAAGQPTDPGAVVPAGGPDGQDPQAIYPDGQQAPVNSDLGGEPQAAVGEPLPPVMPSGEPIQPQ